MGRNNRQRRAAKQRARARRGPTPPRAHRPPAPDSAEEFAEEFAELLDDLRDLEDEFDVAGPSASSPSYGNRHAASTTDRARRLVDGWLATAHRVADPAVLRDWAGRQLWSVEEEVLLRADQLLGHRLLTGVAGLWTGGWQPRDLHHVAQRLDRRTTVLAADLTVEQIRRSGLADLAPDAWREQLATAAARVAEAGLHPAGDGQWTPIGRLISTSASGSDALASALRLLVRMEQLPVIATTLPPPSSWRTAPPRTARPAAATMPDSTIDGRRDKVLGTIRALLAKAESTQFAAEAEALTAKAQALMTRHAVDEALLQAAADEPVDVMSRRVLIDNPYPLEKVRLLNAVGRANRTRVVWMDDVAMATVVGTPVDVDQVELLFTSLLIQATRAMAEAGAAQPGTFDRSPRFRRSFLTSYAVRIGERLTEADAAATASYGTELVPVLRRQQEAVDATYEQLFPHTTEMSSHKSYDRRGWDAGREAANRATFVAGRIAG